MSLRNNTIPFLYLCLKEVLWNTLAKNNLCEVATPIIFSSPENETPYREARIYFRDQSKISFRTLSKVEIIIAPSFEATPNKIISCLLQPKTEIVDQFFVVVVDNDKSKTLAFDSIDSDYSSNPEEIEKISYTQEMTKVVIDVSEGKLCVRIP